MYWFKWLNILISDLQGLKNLVGLQKGNNEIGTTTNRCLLSYIHLNPKSHFGMDFQQFKYSSYQAIISNRNTLLRKDEMIELFDDIQNFIQVHKISNIELEEKFRLE